MIALDAVTVARDGRPALHDVSLRLTQRRIGIIGANGAGKSTLLRLMNGLVLPDRGTVLVDARDTRRDGRSIRRDVGFLFQDPDSQIVFPVAAEDVAFGVRAHGATPDAARERAAAAMAALGIAPLADRRIHELSGGERQLVALAGLLALEPRALLFDEPTAALDLRHRARLAALLRAVPQQIIVATHDLDFLAGFDRVIVLANGRVAADGPPGDAVRFYRASME